MHTYSKYLLAIICSLITSIANSQCDQFVSITPKSPIRVCLKNGPETVKLNGVFSQKPCGFEWSPEDGKISSTKVQNPSVTIDAPGTYTYKLTGAFYGTGPNIVINGDFSMGNVSFGSDMNYTPGPNCPPGNYTITNQNPANFNNAWSDCRNGGNLYLADSPSDPNVKMWYQTVNVTPNTWYIFEFDFASVFFANPPKMVGVINDVELGPTTDAPGATCVWLSTCYAWYSGSNTTAELAIKDKQAITWGDDFVIDNIKFRAACTGSATVKIIAEEQPEIFRDTTKCYGSNITVGGKIISDPGLYDLTLPKGINAACDTILHLTVNDLEILLDSVKVDTLTCKNPKPNIEIKSLFAQSGNGFDTLNFTFLWTTNNGIIESGSTTKKVTVSKAGRYFLKVTYKLGKLICTKNYQFDVPENTSTPIVSAGADRELNCDSTQITLIGNGPPNIAIKWTTKNGLIISGSNSYTPIIGKAGAYIIEATNSENGCKTTDTSLVINNILVPIVTIGKDTLLTCKDTILNIFASVTPNSSNFTYQWTTNNGNIISGSKTNNIFLDQAGIYILLVKDTLTRCEGRDTLIVSGSKVKPIASAGNDNDLDCIKTSINLDGSLSSNGQDFTYNWISTTNQPIVNPTTLNPTVTKSGTYIIQVKNILNNCIAEDTVMINLNADLPKIVIAPIKTIDCQSSTINIDATNSSTGLGYTYNWTTTNGSIVSGQSSTLLTVNDEGDYHFYIFNTTNGCKNDTIVQVKKDLAKPTVIIANPQELNCTTPTITLDATGSSSGSNFSIIWNTSDGNIKSGINSYNPVVNKSGTYWLKITNNNNFCSDSLNIVVNQSVDLPKALIINPPLFGCDKSSIILDGNASSSGANFTINWSTTLGNFVGSTNTLSPTVDKGGDYTLIITNTNNNCKDTAKVTVIEDKIKPIIQLSTPEIITCKKPTIKLDASASDNGIDFLPTWFSSNNKLNNLHYIDVSSKGDYVFVLKNIKNQCIDSIKVTVSENKINPKVDAGLDKNLVCTPNFVVLDGSNSAIGSQYLYKWTGPTNSTIDSPNSSMTNVYNSGNYVLAVEDTINGCTSTDQVNVILNVVYPTIQIDKNTTITCKNPQITINGNGSSTGNNIDYSWSTINGNIVSGSKTTNPIVDKAGKYIFVILDQSTNCKSKDSVIVNLDQTLPTLYIVNPDTLNCKKSIVTIDASSSSNGLEYNYLWSTVNGNILNGQNTLLPTVDKNGNYQLIIENLINGCKDTSYTKVEQDNKKPVALVNVSDTISCKVASVLLDGTTSIMNGNNIDLYWKNITDNIYLSDKTISIQVSKKGKYQLYIQNLSNGCIDSTLSIVLENFEQPILNIQSKNILNCKDTNIVLTGTVITNTSYQFNWFKDNNKLNFNTLTPTINQPGIYKIKATVNSSGCQDSTETTIFSDVQYPIANAGLDTVLNCFKQSINLDGSQSSSGNDYSYQWIEKSGQNIQNATKINPTISNPGTYILNVQNKTNYCTKSDTVIVVNNKIPPTISAIKADSINCIKNEALITAIPANNDPNYIIDWSKLNGNLFGKDFNTLTPTVIQGGTYKLLLTNSLNGCKDSASIKVEIDTIVQKINITPPNYLTCITKELTLNTFGISQPTKYAWTTIDGNFKSSIDIPNPVITAGGKYIVEATNIRNGCKSIASTFVLTDTVAPKINILPYNVIDCNIPFSYLNANSSIPSGLIFNWTTAQGHIQSGGNQGIATVDKGGNYSLNVLNQTNGCTSIANIFVDEDKNIPNANAGPDLELNCKTNEVILDGNQSSKGVDYSYKWTSIDGKIKANGNQIVATGGSTGNYVLLVTNNRNGCKKSDDMVVRSSKPDHIDFVTKTPKCNSNVGSIEIIGASGGKPPYFYTLKDWQTYSIQIPASENIPVGKYVIRVKDANDCETSTYAEIMPSSKPTVLLNPINIEIFEKDSTNLTAQITSQFDIDTVIWTSKDTTFRRVDNLSIWAKPLQSTLYSVKAIDVNGCVDSINSWVFVKEISDVFIPNTFSPNQDAINDYFIPFVNNKTVVKISKLEVFNRWGELIFSRKDFNPNDEQLGWDGTFNGKILNSAVFVYVIEVEFINGRKKIYKGDITLIQD